MSNFNEVDYNLVSNSMEGWGTGKGGGTYLLFEVRRFPETWLRKRNMAYQMRNGSITDVTPQS